jgi:hypothetical protein
VWRPGVEEKDAKNPHPMFVLEEKGKGTHGFNRTTGPSPRHLRWDADEMMNQKGCLPVYIW